MRAIHVSERGLRLYIAGKARRHPRQDRACGIGTACAEPCLLTRSDLEGEPAMKMSPIDRDAETSTLIEHIVETYHRAHRREMPELVALARMVEDLHGTDPAAPHGLAKALSAMADALETHMRQEEEQLFPALAEGRPERSEERRVGKEGRSRGGRKRQTNESHEAPGRTTAA